jgi:hypothetical protein
MAKRRYSLQQLDKLAKRSGWRYSHTRLNPIDEIEPQDGAHLLINRPIILATHYFHNLAGRVSPENFAKAVAKKLASAGIPANDTRYAIKLVKPGKYGDGTLNQNETHYLAVTHLARIAGPINLQEQQV